MTSCAKALTLWSERGGVADPNAEEQVALIGMIPPIQKLDSALNNLAAVSYLVCLNNLAAVSYSLIF